METNPTDALGRLVGEWEVTVDLPDAPAGRTMVQWALRERVLVQRTEIPHSEVPDSMIVVTCDDGGDYTQHYFDSRGVVRIYRMTLTDREWTLVRDTPDFSPLDFCQRFVATFADRGDRIDGQWQTSADGRDWTKDFDLTYRRISGVTA